MDDRDVVVGIGPIGMRRADVDIRFGRHARMADAVRALELAQVVLLGDASGVAEILDQFECIAHRQDFGAFDVLDIVGELLHVAVKVDAIAVGVFGRFFAIDDLHAEGRHALFDLGAAALDLVMNVEALRHVFLLGDLEAHNVLVAAGRSVNRVSRSNPARDASSDCSMAVIS